MPKIPIALIQFDAIPEQIDRNLAEMEVLVKAAVGMKARWIVFHEGTVCDYTPHLSSLAESVPYGKSTKFMANLSRQNDCTISFGLSEIDKDRFYITQVFVGPSGFLYKYRKTWLWREPGDEGYRNEWARYDPGSGPELFLLDGIKATCFICADGDAQRCIQRARLLKPQVVFYPNNRGDLPDFDEFGALAKEIGAPMLVTNRTGLSWVDYCNGGCVAYSSDGEVLKKANRKGQQEILFHELDI
jgi:predicted amidohydrolase